MACCRCCQVKLSVNVKFLYWMLNNWFAPIDDMPLIATIGITPRSLPGNTSGMFSPSADRRFLSAAWFVSLMVLPENWNWSSFIFDDPCVDRRIAEATCPGTFVSVVDTFGTAKLRKSPPGSSVKLLSCVYRPVMR